VPQITFRLGAEMAHGPGGHWMLQARGRSAPVSCASAPPTLGWVQRPAIHAVDDANEFLLLEDRSDDTFATCPASGGGGRRPKRKPASYGPATDVLVALHAAGERALLAGLAPMPARPDRAAIAAAGMVSARARRGRPAQRRRR